MRKIEKLLPYLAVAIAPAIAAAQASGTIGFVVIKLGEIFTALIPVLITLTTIVFIWGVIVYITAGSSEEKKSYAKYLIAYGLVALFAVVASWGLVKVLADTFGVVGKVIPVAPGPL